MIESDFPENHQETASETNFSTSNIQISHADACVRCCAGIRGILKAWRDRIGGKLCVGIGRGVGGSHGAKHSPLSFFVLPEAAKHEYLQIHDSYLNSSSSCHQVKGPLPHAIAAHMRQHDKTEKIEAGNGDFFII